MWSLANSKDILFPKIQNFKNWPLQVTFWPFSLKMRPNFFVKVFLPQNLDFEPNEKARETPFGIFQKYAYLTKPFPFCVLSRIYSRLYSRVDCFRLILCRGNPFISLVAMPNTEPWFCSAVLSDWHKTASIVRAHISPMKIQIEKFSNIMICRGKLTLAAPRGV